MRKVIGGDQMRLTGFLFSTKAKNGRANCNVGSLREQKNSNVDKYGMEASQDISLGILDENMVFCPENGVQFIDIPGMIKLVYTGLLAQSRNQEIYAVIGYGANDKWEDISEFKMNNTAAGTFELLAHKKRRDNVNVALRDKAGNWDNNYGNNYVFFDNRDIKQ
ncbi:MAG: carbohydrate-binding protein [Bacillota bacterium]|nr:carbohydrate-binding protein [Bacillota bacterium]